MITRLVLAGRMLKRADKVEVGVEYRLTRDLTTRARQTLDSEEVHRLSAGTVRTIDRAHILTGVV
eukprot:COSAG02_NODE_107_length_36312_cov_45.037942_36_plen_65_part_00